MADSFRPGHTAPCSGVFKAIHSLKHSEPHYIILLYRDVFPVCQECGDEVRFELAFSAIYIKSHPAFQAN
jgi:hypothetical protein